MPAITVSQVGDPATSPSTAISVTGLTIGQTVTVYRQAPGEEAQNVRGAYDRVATSEAVVTIDTTPPLGRLTTYVLYVDGTYVSSANITLTFTGHHLLTDPITGVGVECDIDYSANPGDERTAAARSSILQPVGAKYPVALYDTRTSDTGTLVLLLDSRTTTQAMTALLASGRPLASRHRNDSCDVASVEYLYFADAARARYQRAGARRFTLAFTQVELPDPLGESVLVTLNDIYNYYLTGTLLTISSNPSFATLLDIAEYDFGVI